VAAAPPAFDPKATRVLSYLVRRLLWAGVLFVGVTVITYALFFVLPADPARLAAGKSATSEDVARVAHQLGLDRPVHEQYGLFLKRLVVDHSLGRSYTNRRSVNEMVGEAVPVTAALVFGGAVLWMLVALPIGILSALKPRSLIDRGAMIFILVGISAPVVWIGLLLQYFVGFRWGLTPNAGYCDVFSPPEGASCGGPADWAYHLILPWTTFAILFAASYARMVRANVMDTLGEDYVRTARAKGAPENVVIRRHVLRNALLPIVTMLGLDIGVALGGAIFTEAIFNLPGLGRLALNSVLNLDLPTMQGVVVFATLAIIVLNVVVDLVYAVLDPRIRLA
jgi:peptide/nickel transport system permease protein